MNDPMVNVLGPLDGAEIPGGCDNCDAYQTVRAAGALMWSITVHHDEDCPTWAKVQDLERQRRPRPAKRASHRQGRKGRKPR
jgi:hypothetical protein